MALALTPPACAHLMLNAAYGKLDDVVARQELPASDVELALLVQILALSAMAAPLAAPGSTLQVGERAAKGGAGGEGERAISS